MSAKSGEVQLPNKNQRTTFTPIALSTKGLRQCDRRVAAEECATLHRPQRVSLAPSIHQLTKQSTPPEAQTDIGIWTSREVQSLKELILEYHRLTMISPQENSSPQMGTPDSSQIPVPALASEINQPDASPESFARGHDSARMIPPKVLNIRHRSVVPSRFVDVKARLIALWHQSLARSQRGSSRTVLSNSNKDANKKADATSKGW